MAAGAPASAAAAPDAVQVSHFELEALRQWPRLDIRPEERDLQAMLRAGRSYVFATARICIDRGGVPTTVELVERSGFGGYDGKLISAMRTWRYSPVMRDGEARAACAPVAFMFHPSLQLVPGTDSGKRAVFFGRELTSANGSGVKAHYEGKNISVRLATSDDAADVLRRRFGTGAESATEGAESVAVKEGRALIGGETKSRDAGTEPGFENDKVRHVSGGRYGEMLTRRGMEVDSVFAQLQRATGTGLDIVPRDRVEEVFDYLFQSQGIQLDYANYTAWRRLSLGAGTVDDLRFIRHELKELEVLRKEGLEDPIGKDLKDLEIERWRATFDKEFLPAHRQALDAELDLIRSEILKRTHGQVDLSLEEIAMSDPLRAEARNISLRDGKSLRHNAKAKDWNRSAERVRLPVEVATALGLSRSTTIADLIRAVKGRRFGSTQ